MVPVHSSALFTSCPGRNAFEKPGENKGGRQIWTEALRRPRKRRAGHRMGRAALTNGSAGKPAR